MAADDDDPKRKIIRLLNEAKPVRRRSKTPAKADFYVNGDGNIFSGRDTIITPKLIQRTTVHAPPGSLTPSQAKRIRDRIEHLVNIEAAGGVYDGDRQRLFGKWHRMLQDRFDVPSYLLISTHRADEVLAWLRQVAAMNRPKLRRTDNDAWRNEHYRAIWARARELGLSKGDVYGLVLNRLEKQVTSLKQLGEQSLHRLYEIVMNLR